MKAFTPVRAPKCCGESSFATTRRTLVPGFDTLGMAQRLRITSPPPFVRRTSGGAGHCSRFVGEAKFPTRTKTNLIMQIASMRHAFLPNRHPDMPAGCMLSVAKAKRQVFLTRRAWDPLG